MKVYELMTLLCDVASGADVMGYVGNKELGDLMYVDDDCGDMVVLNFKAPEDEDEDEDEE